MSVSNTMYQIQCSGESMDTATFEIYIDLSKGTTNFQQACCSCVSSKKQVQQNGGGADETSPLPERGGSRVVMFRCRLACAQTLQSTVSARDPHAPFPARRSVAPDQYTTPCLQLAARSASRRPRRQRLRKRLVGSISCS